MEALHAPPLGGRHRSPAADSGAAVRHSPSAADTVLRAGRHGSWRRPTRHLAPADKHTQPRPTRPPRRPTHRGRHRPCPQLTRLLVHVLRCFCKLHWVSTYRHVVYHHIKLIQLSDMSFPAELPRKTHCCNAA